MTAAPTVFGPDRLAADIAADFAVRGIVADIVVGTWETMRLRSLARVIVGEGEATYESSADTPHATDGWIDIGGGQVAQAQTYRAQVFPIWVTCLAPDGTAQEATEQTAREATTALLDATAKAVQRTRGGLPMLPWPVRIEPEESGEFIFGSVKRFDAKIAVPVFDDPSDTATAEEAEGTAQLDLDGTDTPAVPEEQIGP